MGRMILLKLIICTTIIMFMNISGVDLNLLLAFDAVMRERHVTRAAESLYMTQPALSNALNRLRHVFKDELFVRGPQGMRPTQKALELEEPISRAMAAVEEAINPPVFDPACSEHTFRLVCHDHFVHTGLSKLMHFVDAQAPGIDIRLLPAKGDSFALLDAQEADFGISAYGLPPERFGWEKLLTDEYVVVMGADNPLAMTDDWGKLAYSKANHLLVSLSGDASGFVDKALAAEKLTRRIALTVNHFSATPEILSHTSLVATLPRKLAEHYCKYYPLTMLCCPVTPPAAYCDNLLVWHKRLSKHPANDWLKQTLRALYANA